MTMLDHPPRVPPNADELEPFDEVDLDASGGTPLWPALPRPTRPGPTPPARPIGSTAQLAIVPLEPRRRAGRRRHAALLVALATAAGGVAGGTVARLTERPGTTTVVAAAPGAAGAPATTASGAGAAPTPVSPADAFDVPAVIERVGASIVTIEATATATGPWGRTYEQEGAGTGFVLATGGLIATNQHVVDGAETIWVMLSDGTKLAATVVGESPADDLAVLRVDRADLVPLAFGSSAALRVGTAVVAVGNALALEGGVTASLGIISAKGRTITTSSGSTYENLLQTDAAINAGDSGGPLVDREGKVVGINAAGTTQAENIGFAIPIDDAGPVLLALAAGPPAAT